MSTPINIRIAFDQADYDMLRALVDHAGKPAAAVIRLLVRAAYAEHFGSKKPKTAKPLRGQP
jgi:hypothetical protein